MVYMWMNHALLIWLCKRAKPSIQVAQWLEIQAVFSYQIKNRPGKKQGNADRLSQHPEGGCKQCLNVERRYVTAPRSNMEAQFDLPSS